MKVIDSAAQTERVIAMATRRLGLLQERRAALGFSADPAITIEIEDIQQAIADMRASLTRPPAPARVEDLSEHSVQPAKHRGLVVLVGPGRAGVNPITQAAGAAITHHLSNGAEKGLEYCWLLPSGVEDLDPPGAKQRSQPSKQRDAVEIARDLAQECAAHGVQARIRPVGDAFDVQATHAMVQWIFAADLPDGVAETDVICDFTGGTKLMSAGMILACGTGRSMQCMVFDVEHNSIPMLVRLGAEGSP